MFRRLASFKSLSKHHLTDSNHTAPADIAVFVSIIMTIAIADPYNIMKSSIKFFLFLISVLLAKQIGRFRVLFEDNLFPIYERAGGVLDVIYDVGCHLFYGALRTTVHTI